MTDRAKLLALRTAEHIIQLYNAYGINAVITADESVVVARALKHFLDAAPALQEDLAHHAVSPTADDGTRVGLQSLPPVATPPAAVTDAMIDEARSGCPEFFRDAMYQGQAACAQRRREVSRTITHEQRVSFYHAQQVFMRERDRIQQEIDTRTTKLEAIEIGLTTLDNMLGDYKVKP